MFLNKRHFRADGFSIFQSVALGHRLFLTACLLLATIVLVFLFTPSIILVHTFATPEPDPEEAIPVSPFISLSVAGNTNNIALDIASLSPNGNFKSSSTVDNIRAYTSNYTGYTLGIAAKVDNDNALSYTPSGSSTTYEIPSITTSVSAADYADDTYASANGLNNTWGYRPSTLYDVTSDDNVANTDFLPGPTSTVDQTIIAKTKGPNASGNTDDYNISIGARVDNTTPPGSYTNTFVITAVVNPISYTIIFNKGNTTDAVSGLPNNQTGIISNHGISTDITLTSDAPTRNNYAFTGWCSTVPTTSNKIDSCGGISYPAGGTYPLDATKQPSIVLYAMWRPTIYSEVEAMNKGTQTASDLKAVITKPTSSDPATDTSNSGVYLYDEETFGAAAGDGAYYPNYVRLGDTCWRIVRTTASGGVKMIYNGLYSAGTTANSCANAQGDTHAKTANNANGTMTFNGDLSTKEQIVRVGYTYNSAYATNTAQTAKISQVFGSNSNYSVNDTDSTIKDYIEDDWFPAINNYENILEPNAGYCNDRTVYDFSDVLQNETTTDIETYGTSSSVTPYQFGASFRNLHPTHAPTLSCSRSTADLYSVSTDNGGNGQLDKPTALLTADELAFAGSGADGRTSVSPYYSSNYSYSSYLRSGSGFWLLSPSHRGMPYSFYLNPDGSIKTQTSVGNALGVRPAISLASETTYSSGAGTAVDPWVVTAP